MRDIDHEIDIDDVLLEFYEEIGRDRRDGVQRPLSEYLEGVTGAAAESAVAREFLWMQAPDGGETAAVDADVARATDVREASETTRGPFVGQLLAERYEPREFIAGGGQADVWLGVDRERARPVAIKILRSAWSKRALARAAAEASLIAELDHPRICHMIDAGEHNGTPYLVMDWIDGKTLAVLMREGRWREARSSRAGLERIV